MAYDVIVIGAGPAGLMATAAAAEQGASVLLLEKGKKLGKKLAISGGGRCNVTNRKPTAELVQYIPGNGKFLFSPLSQFGQEDIIDFFEALDIAVKEEDRGRMFPVSDRAQSVVAALVAKIEDLSVTIQKHTKVTKLLHNEEVISGVELDSGEQINSRQVIIASGGKSVPNTGSTGDGYIWAEACGHTITHLYPTEVPLTSTEPFIKAKTLQGLSLRDVAVSVLNPKGKKLTTHRWDLLFTHQGLSGPAVLRCSQFVVKALWKQHIREVTVVIDTQPDEREEEVYQILLARAKQAGQRSLKNAWKGLVPERYLIFLLQQCGLSTEVNYHQLALQKVRKMAAYLKAFPVQVNGTLSIEKAFITGGGVSLKEVNPKTLASKKMQGLYLCGEVLDIHGYTGGYNITAAFSTGHAAGTAAARCCLTSEND